MLPIIGYTNNKNSRKKTTEIEKRQRTRKKHKSTHQINRKILKSRENENIQAQEPSTYVSLCVCLRLYSYFLFFVASISRARSFKVLIFFSFASVDGHFIPFRSEILCIFHTYWPQNILGIYWRVSLIRSFISYEYMAIVCVRCAAHD